VKKRSIFLIITAIIVLVLMGIFNNKNYLLMSFIFLALTIGIYFIRFEK
jgi:hypothetical protein